MNKIKTIMSDYVGQSIDLLLAEAGIIPKKTDAKYTKETQKITLPKLIKIK